MKKTLSVVALIALSASLVACSGGEKKEPAATEAPKVVEETPAAAPATEAAAPATGTEAAAPATGTEAAAPATEATPATK